MPDKTTMKDVTRLLKQHGTLRFGDGMAIASHTEWDVPKDSDPASVQAILDYLQPLGEEDED